MCGWIKLYRKITEWEWYRDPNTSRVFLHILLTANWKDEQSRGRLIKRGQRVFTINELADETRLSVRQTRTALSHLKTTSELTIETTNKFSVATIENYELYQCDTSEIDKQNDKQIDRQTTNKTVKSDKPTILYKNLKELKNIARTREEPSPKRFIPPSVDEVSAYCKERKNGVDAEQFVDFYCAKGWKVGQSAMKDWKAAVRTWEKRNGRSEKITKLKFDN